MFRLFLKKPVKDPLGDNLRAVRDEASFRHVADIIRDAGFRPAPEIDETRARALGARLYREHGIERASYLADLIVAQVQLCARERAAPDARRVLVTEDGGIHDLD